MIELAGVTKTFGSFTAVRDVSLRVDDGELYGFLGPNGAGKTTTVKMMVGLLRPSEGTLSVGGLNVRGHPEAVKRRTGYIPDTPYVYPQLTMDEYFGFIQDLYDLDENRAGDLRRRYAERFQLTNWHQDLIQNLSHGMKQKMLFTALFMREPDAMVIDEPMVGLDPRSSRVLKDALRRQVEERSTSVFLSTHSLEVAQEICDRVGILRSGSLLAEGTYRNLKQREDRSLEDVFLRLTNESPRAATE